MHAARLPAAPLSVALVSMVASATTPRVIAAQPSCATGTVADYLALGTTGCRIGDATFGAFDLGSITLGIDRDALSLAPVTRTAAGRSYVGLQLTLSAPVRATSAAALAGTNICRSGGGYCYGDVQRYGFGFTVVGTALAGYALTDLVGAASASATWSTEAGAAIVAPRPTDLADGFMGGAALGHVADAGGSRGPLCGPVRGNVLVFGGPLAAPATLCGADQLPIPPSGRYSVLLSAQAVTFDFGPSAVPPSGEAAAQVTSVVAMFDVGAATTVPEPTTVALLAPALLVIGAAARRRRATV